MVAKLNLKPQLNWQTPYFTWFKSISTTTFSFDHGSNSSVDPASNNLVPKIYNLPNQQITTLVNSTIEPTRQLKTIITKCPTGIAFILLIHPPFLYIRDITSFSKACPASLPDQRYPPFQEHSSIHTLQYQSHKYNYQRHSLQDHLVHQIQSIYQTQSQIFGN